MRIPATLNAYSVALAGLGHHTLGGVDSGQVTGNLPIDGLQAFISVIDEPESAEATFLLPGVVSDEGTALAIINALQYGSTGLCRLVVVDGHLHAKASLFTGGVLTASRVQSWWHRCLEEVIQWYTQAREYSILVDGGMPQVPEHLQPSGEVFDVFTSDPRVDDERCAAVTVERVVESMTEITGGAPAVRTIETSHFVEASIGGQALDIEVTASELRFVIASSLRKKDPSLSEVLAGIVNQRQMMEPAPAAFVLDDGDSVEVHTRAVVDTNMGLDDQTLRMMLEEWASYVYNFNERIFN